MKKLFLLFSTVLLMFGPISLMARSLDEIRKAGTLKVGVALATPWVLKDAQGELTGSEIDIASLLTTDMGVEQESIVLAWNDLIPALKDDKIDVIIAGMSITPARALEVAFSQPYAESTLAVLARREGPAAAAQDAQNMNQENIKIGVTKGTVAAQTAQQLFYQAQVVELPGFKELIDALEQGQVDAVVTSQPLPRLSVLQHPDKYLEPIR
ncbi:MAG TPA: transporter substrate-binding domain-containing protein, partial [Candidatus Competibacteraceae bacterium]|nr:transporter substrate-binding domain-containing protein [Candidatus Competibacteraceae bacterium]